MTNFANQKILVIGLGRFGGSLGIIKYLHKQGAILKITDLKPADKLQDSLDKLSGLANISYTLGRHDPKDLDWADIVVVSPAVPPSSPFLKTAIQLNKPLETEINLFFKLTKANTIGVTGTNGKATVSGLIHQMLSAHFGRNNVLLGGNMGISLLDQAKTLKPSDWVILELSSFQLARLAWIKKSPRLALLTNITPDHLDWHQTLSTYITDKLNIFRFQQSSDHAFVNFYDPQSRRRLDPWPFASTPHILQPGSPNAIKSQTQIIINHKIIDLPAHKLIGRHNLFNIAQAAMLADYLGAPASIITSAIAAFTPPEHALEQAGIINNVTFINDSEASNQDAALKALGSLPPGKIILIAGGYDKGIDLSLFAEKISQTVKHAILIGQTAPKLAQLLKTHNFSAFTLAPSLKQAVDLAYQKAQPGDYVILSPAASSYDMFANLEQRGRIFKQYVKQLKKA
ncbi:MAG: UDP-N-acetylmuramoyl-L-alanine--D-glutamate ligase [bacterium]|nr:UDP-N-acetylmuramoyl-L-alanine--D-glutamate ligase [bacterium]